MSCSSKSSCSTISFFWSWLPQLSDACQILWCGASNCMAEVCLRTQSSDIPEGANISEPQQSKIAHRTDSSDHPLQRINGLLESPLVVEWTFLKWAEEPSVTPICTSCLDSLSGQDHWIRSGWWAHGSARFPARTASAHTKDDKHLSAPPHHHHLGPGKNGTAGTSHPLSRVCLPHKCLRRGSLFARDKDSAHTGRANCHQCVGSGQGGPYNPHFLEDRTQVIFPVCCNPQLCTGCLPHRWEGFWGGPNPAKAFTDFLLDYGSTSHGKCPETKKHAKDKGLA